MDHHRIATEPDRRAHQALTNIRRLHNYRQQLARLERERDRLTQTLLRHERATTCHIHAMTCAILAGHRVLAGGGTHEQAMTTALAALEE